MKRIRFILFLLLGAACASTGPAPQPLHDLFGVTVGMSKADVHAKLAAAGKMSREERKRQEVWSVDDPRYEGVIVGYDPDWNVRFVTAVARTGGKEVHFADVLDVARAEHKSAGETHNYRWQPPGTRYAIVAIGDGRAVKYVTLTNGRQEEEEEDD